MRTARRVVLYSCLVIVPAGALAAVWTGAKRDAKPDNGYSLQGHQTYVPAPAGSPGGYSTPFTDTLPGSRQSAAWLVRVDPFGTQSANKAVTAVVPTQQSSPLRAVAVTSNTTSSNTGQQARHGQCHSSMQSDKIVPSQRGPAAAAALLLRGTAQGSTSVVRLDLTQRAITSSTAWPPMRTPPQTNQRNHSVTTWPAGAVDDSSCKHSEDQGSPFDWPESAVAESASVRASSNASSAGQRASAMVPTTSNSTRVQVQQQQRYQQRHQQQHHQQQQKGVEGLVHQQMGRGLRSTSLRMFRGQHALQLRQHQQHQRHQKSVRLLLASDAIIGKDDLVNCRRSPWPDQVVGQLDITDSTGDQVCPGTLIGPDLVITAAHCVWNEFEGRFVQKISFAPGRYKDGCSIISPHGAVPWLYATMFKSYNDSWLPDVAVVRLIVPFGLKLGWLGLKPACELEPLAQAGTARRNDSSSPSSPSASSNSSSHSSPRRNGSISSNHVQRTQQQQQLQVKTAGYPGGSELGQCKISSCCVPYSTCSALIPVPHTCDTLGGQSGAAMWDEQGYVRLVHSAGDQTFGTVPATDAGSNDVLADEQGPRGDQTVINRATLLTPELVTALRHL